MNEILSIIKEGYEYVKRTNTFGSIEIELLNNAKNLIQLQKDDYSKYITDKIANAFSQQNYSLCTNYVEMWIVNQTIIHPQNNVDTLFLKIVNLVLSKSVVELAAYMQTSMQNLRNQSEDVYQGIKQYYDKYQFWGKVDLDEHIYDLFISRAHSLHEHLYDFERLYYYLGDYRSKHVLVSILTNWLLFDLNALDKAKERAFEDYFDLDIISCENEVFVDLGAFIGDTLASFVNVYGKKYSKYYCYEILSNNCAAIKKLVEDNGLENVIIKNIGVGKEHGEMAIEEGIENSSFKLADNGKNTIEVVSLDEDIKDPITFLKMDIEGAEYDALLGAKNHIINDHPKLAISVYHNNEDIWKIANLIMEYDSSYRFYLRYNGGNGVPTETILLAI